jgi:peptidoglycan-associated lipoprotein
MTRMIRSAAPAAAVMLAVFAGACSKKVAATTPQPPAPVANDTAPAKAAPAVANRPAPAPQATQQPQASPQMTPQQRAQLNEQLARLEDALFDYDKSTIRPDAAKALSDNVAAIRATLSKYPNEKITIEGHCDQRGSDEYNMALGERRAEASKEFLVNMGISAAQLTTISYGKERPQCTEDNEDCYQRNRRAHLIARGE